jgi:hypothetical protein
MLFSPWRKRSGWQLSMFTLLKAILIYSRVLHQEKTLLYFSLIYPTTKKSSLLRGLPGSKCLIFSTIDQINTFIFNIRQKSSPCSEVTTYLIFTKIKSTASTNYYYLTLHLSNHVVKSTGDKFVIYIPIRTTEVNPLENGLLHPVIWPSNTREYGFPPRGFNQSKVAIEE